MDNTLKLSLTSFGKLTAGKDEYLLLNPQPLEHESLNKFPGTKFYVAYIDQKDGEIFNPHVVSVGDGFHLDILHPILGRAVEVTVYDKGGTTEEELTQIEISELISQ